VTTRSFHLDGSSEPFALDAGQYTLLWRHESRDGYASLEEVLPGDQLARRATMAESPGYIRELDLPAGDYRITFHGGIASLDVHLERIW
jgi:hypothetical protein